MFLKRLPFFNKGYKKIKLAAIAKDEAAYLPEWIHHHCYFGFDEIEIYVNNTSDNTFSLLNKIKKKYPIKVVNADFIFEMDNRQSFQGIAYSLILKKSVKEGFTHVMFLDIDEFWTPLDFKTTIKECLIQLNNPDIISFEWCLKWNEENQFQRPFSKKNIVSKYQLVKTIFKASLRINNIFVHNVASPNAQYLLADGSIFDSDLEHKYAVDGPNKFGQIKDFYILHRIYRSPMEYISMLGQGMRQAKKNGNNTSNMEFKTNRNGYLKTDSKPIDLNKPEELLEAYNKDYLDMISRCSISSEIDIARKFVKQRYDSVLDIIPFLNEDLDSVIKETLINISISEVNNAYEEFKKRIS